MMGPTDFSSDLSFGFCGQLSERRMTNSLPIIQIAILVSIQHLSEGCNAIAVVCPLRDLNILPLGSESYSLSTRPPRLAFLLPIHIWQYYLLATTIHTMSENFTYKYLTVIEISQFY